MLVALILVGAQIIMTRRYGWRGLACATVAAIVVVFGAGAIIETWMPWKPSPLDEFGFYRGLFLAFLKLGNFFIVSITAILLAFTIKTE